MPELPEAETIRRHLAPRVEGHRIRDLRIRKGDILLDVEAGAFRRALRGRTVSRVGRRAKFPLLWLDDGRVLEVQLRMSGRLVVGRSRPDPEIFRHVVAEFDLDDGLTLYYDDQRRLGGFRLWDVEGWRRRDATLGPEPLDAAFTPERLAGILDGRRAPVKNVLVDQRRVAGIGNIYAAEILWASELDPRRPGGSLDAGEVRRLHRAVREVLREAVEHAGTTFRSYLWSGGGDAGRFQERLRAYGREEEPCPRCGAPVERIVQAGRSTYFCPGCQA